jgi:TolB-like protein/Tfp pilus assembly protein PilF
MAVLESLRLGYTAANDDENIEIMSFLEELKRRNVVRVGIAYAVGAWVLLQIFDVIGEILVLPEWGGKLILAMIIIGFFLALFFAWAFELTPEGIKREHEVDRTQSITPQTGKKLNNAILVLMAVAIAYLLFDKFYLSKQLTTIGAETAQATTQQPAEAMPEASAPTAVDRKSIAVLPFDNRSRLQEDEFFVEGIHDDLLTNLARIGSLKVISRTSVGKYKDTQKSIPEIATELGVATVMEGAVQRSGNTVRINVQLIDAHTDEHLWAEIFDRELTADNLFAIQSEISEEIAKALQATLSPDEQQRLNERPTENLAAYNAYLRGRQLMSRRNSADMDQAAREFQRAVELDPEFALAWVGVAETASLQSQYSDLGLAEAVESQLTATERALAIDDRLGEAYLGLAEFHSFHQRNTEADAAYRKAIELSPGYASAYHWYSNFLAQFPNRLSESLEVAQKALELDPLASIIQLSLTNKFIRLGRYDDAQRQLDRLAQLDPDFVPAFGVKADLAAQRGRFDEQIHWLRKSAEADPGRLTHYIPMMWAYVDIGDVQPLDDIKRQMAAINENHALLGVADLVSSVHSANYAAALESGRWAYERMGRPPFFNFFFAYINTLKRDYGAARESFEAAMPGVFDRAQWRTAIEQQPDDACFVGWVMMVTGDQQMGSDLARASLDYLQQELPGYIQHADRYSLDACYLALGEPDKALSAIETRVDHKHYGSWWFMRQMPLYEPLWGNPRFEAAMQKIQDDIAVQRANLAKMQTAAYFPE